MEWREDYIYLNHLCGDGLFDFNDVSSRGVYTSIMWWSGLQQARLEAL